MQLKYRGVSYETNPTHVGIIGKKNKFMYRGCSYNMTGAVINLNNDSSEKMTYRGVTTGETYEKRFLGQTCTAQRVCLQPVTG